jgi:hypothetical protein
MLISFKILALVEAGFDGLFNEGGGNSLLFFFFGEAVVVHHRLHSTRPVVIGALR